MSHEENKQAAGTLVENLEWFSLIAVQFAGTVQEVQEGTLAALAEELPNNEQLEAVVDSVSDVKARAEEIHRSIELAQEQMREVVHALNQAG